MKNKLIGIGTIALMILLPIAPAVTGTSLGIQIGHQPSKAEIYNPDEKKLLKDEVLQTLEQYQEELEALNNYVNEYIEEHGGLDENFYFTPYLQNLVDTITSEIEQTINPYEPSQGNGKTDYEAVFSLFPMRMLHRFWIDQFWTQVIFSEVIPQNPMTMALVLYSIYHNISYRPGTIVAIKTIASILADYEPPIILGYDYGKGIIINAVDYFVPSPLTIDDVWIEPQL